MLSWPHILLQSMGKLCYLRESNITISKLGNVLLSRICCAKPNQNRLLSSKRRRFINLKVNDFLKIMEIQLVKNLLHYFTCEKKNNLPVKAIYKTRNTGTGNGMRAMQGMQRMFTSIPGNLLENSGEFSHFSIPGNVREDSGECSRGLRGMFKKIPGNFREDSEECSRRFRGMFKKILGNVPEDSEECSETFWEMFRKIP